MEKCHLLSWEKLEQPGFEGVCVFGVWEGDGMSIIDLLQMSEIYSRGKIKQAGRYASKTQNSLSAMKSLHWKASTRNGI